MHDDWKWDGDRGERRLADGRVLRLRDVSDQSEWAWRAEIDTAGGIFFDGFDTRESAVEAVEKAAGVDGVMPGTESREVQALRNCRAMAAREVRKCPPGKERDAWEHVLRFCREGGVEAVVMRSEQRPHAAASAETGETFSCGCEPFAATMHAMRATMEAAPDVRLVNVGDPPQTALQAAVERDVNALPAWWRPEYANEAVLHAAATQGLGASAALWETFVALVDNRRAYMRHLERAPT